MKARKVGVLHPGQMGESMAAAVKQSGHQVYWSAEGRSEKTRARAVGQSLINVGDINEMCREVAFIISICPPRAAEDVAKEVVSAGFKGLYLDANAISPSRSIAIGELMEKNGASFVDGGIVGPPAWKAETSWLHLSGKKAAEAAGYFENGPFTVKLIDENVGKASALKMTFAAYTKGTTALLAAILGTAERFGVKEELVDQWRIFGPDFIKQVEGRIIGSTDRAWRWVGEMEEIAATIEEAGLPGGFHFAAADIYRRLSLFKDRELQPSLEEALSALNEK